jgi:hypothetical protein
MDKQATMNICPSRGRSALINWFWLDNRDAPTLCGIRVFSSALLGQRGRQAPVFSIWGSHFTRVYLPTFDGRFLTQGRFQGLRIRSSPFFW